MANFGNNINFNNNFFVINKVKMATQCKDVVLPTPLDFINAIMYTSDRIKKEKCQDVDIVKKFLVLNGKNVKKIEYTIVLKN